MENKKKNIPYGVQIFNFQLLLLLNNRRPLLYSLLRWSILYLYKIGKLFQIEYE